MAKSGDGEHIICFDGVCNLCNGSVSFILKIDRFKLYKFCSIQGKSGDEFLMELKIKKDLSSIIYIESLDRRIYYDKSEAILQIAKNLGFPYNFISFVGRILVPSQYIRDKIYDWVSRNRYKWFGQSETCRKPSQEEKDRFL
jgi:predicted DCC family thiol-disulfide oxidoreductase YuxK